MTTAVIWLMALVAFGVAPQEQTEPPTASRPTTEPAIGSQAVEDGEAVTWKSRPTEESEVVPAPEVAASEPATAASEPTDGGDAEPASSSAPALKRLTREMLFGPENRVDFVGSYQSGFTWLSDGRSFLHRRDGTLMRVDAVSDRATPPYDVERFEQALRASGDFDADAVTRVARDPGTLTEDRSRAVIRHNKCYYVYDFEPAAADPHDTAVIGDEWEEPEIAGRIDGARTDSAASGRAPGEPLVRRIDVGEGAFDMPRLSSDGRFMAFARDYDLHVIDLDAPGGKLTRLTSGGNQDLRNGVFDWVYAEEVFGHGRPAYWWSPDGKRLAYIQLNEDGVPRYSIADQLPYHLRIEATHYPKAGDKNPTARLGIVGAETGVTTWVDLSAYEGGEFLIVRVSWAPDGKLMYQVQDREQTWLDLNEADPVSGASRNLFRESSPAWVDVLGTPHWLADGSFLWSSQRDGWRHIYHYARDGELIARVTGGDWEARALHGVDEAAGWVYLSGTRDSPIQSNAYRVQLDGSGLERLTEPGFDHRVNFDPHFRYFFDTYSNVMTAPRVDLRHSDGSLLRVISANDVKTIHEFELGEVKFLRVPTRDGYVMNAMLVLPPRMEEGKKYPVWSYTYSGPHAPSVRNAWQGGGLMHSQYFAQQGYMVWVCDNRSCSGQGAVSAWQNYMRLGVSECQDLEDGLRWLIANYPADPERIGIHGHSYGGFQTSFCLTNSTMFKLGVAGAPVTDWRCYDTIYTERYMRTPQNNPQGYERTSPTKLAKNLHGRLLIMHGLMDDNVHFQNSVQFVDQLQRAGKQFDVMFYPRAGHGLFPGDHVVEMRDAFVLGNL